MIIGNKSFDNVTYVMAIINLTPDSFWKESRKTCDNVLFAVERAVKEGARHRHRRAVVAPELYRGQCGRGNFAICKAVGACEKKFRYSAFGGYLFFQKRARRA